MASLVIYENGTLGGVDGSACSSGDFSQPLGPITTLNTTGSAVVRVDASTHYCASGGLTLVGSSGLEFSWDESTWAASATNSSADVSYVNKMLYYRQTTNATGASGHFTSSADLSTTTQLADVTGLTASATASGGAYYVTWLWTAVANASFYLIEYGAGTAYNTSAITSASSYTASGLSAGTEYGAQVKADGSGRYTDSANYVTASATPTLSYPLTDDANTMALWRFLEATGTSVADDSGEGNTLTLYGTPSWTTVAGWGTALDLNGTSQYGEAADAAALRFDGSSFTLEAIFVADTVPDADGEYGMLICKQDSDSTGYALWSEKESGENAHYIGGFVDSSMKDAYYDTTLTTGTIRYLAFVWNKADGIARLYLDGTEVDTSTYSTTNDPAAGTKPVTIGRFGKWGAGTLDRYFDGKMLGVKLSNVARDATYISNTWGRI